MAIGKENFMWECSSICTHRWGKLASERPTWASHTTTNSRSEQIYTEQICWFLLQQKGCLRYQFFNKPALFNLYLLTKGQERPLCRISMRLTFIALLKSQSFDWPIASGRTGSRNGWELGCLSVGNQWYLFNYWMNLISSTAVITGTA